MVQHIIPLCYFVSRDWYAVCQMTTVLLFYCQDCLICLKCEFVNSLNELKDQFPKRKIVCNYFGKVEVFLMCLCPKMQAIMNLCNNKEFGLRTRKDHISQSGHAPFDLGGMLLIGSGLSKSFLIKTCEIFKATKTGTSNLRN